MGLLSFLGLRDYAPRPAPRSSTVHPPVKAAARAPRGVPAPAAPAHDPAPPPRPELPALPFDDETRFTPLAAFPAEATPAIDEAAVMFGLGHAELAEDMLNGLAEGATDDIARLAWAMLFDLYEADGRRELFERKSLEFARRFEVSPPLWHDGAHARPAVPALARLVFEGRLDAGMTRHLAGLRELPAAQSIVTLDFAHATAIDMNGCTILLGMFKSLQGARKQIALTAGAALLHALRALVHAEGAQQAPWLALMECYRLLDMEKEFEECSLDYCIAFEVSPPPFVRPDAPRHAPAADDMTVTQTVSYSLPEVITDQCHPELEAIAAYAAAQDPALFDARRLRRIDFHAASVLQALLQPVAAKGRRIEIRGLNHLVLALLRAVGLHDIAHLVVRR